MAETSKLPLLPGIVEPLERATRAKKCAPCGCFHDAVESLEASRVASALGPVLQAARGALAPVDYACLGCPTCWPAEATNALAEIDPTAPAPGCPTEAPALRRGWPPLPGDYHVRRARAPVAVCTLGDDTLARRLADADVPGLSIVGTLHTENLGIERVVVNVVANPSLRFLVLCGADARQAVGHLPGASLKCLVTGGIDDRGRIVGAPGKRPVIRNVDRKTVAAFRDQVALVDRIGVADVDLIIAEVAACAARDPGPAAGPPGVAPRGVVRAEAPSRLIPDPAGYLVVYPDRDAQRLVLEHYTGDGVLTCVVEGETPAALYATAVARELVSRLDHAAYLGRELARAERSLATGEPYVQDRAPGETLADPGPADRDPEQATPSRGCGCGPGETCGGG